MKPFDLEIKQKEDMEEKKPTNLDRNRGKKHSKGHAVENSSSQNYVGTVRIEFYE